MASGPARYESPRLRARWTLALLTVFGLMVIAVAVSSAMEIDLLREIQDGKIPSISKAAANDDRQRAVSSLYFLTFVSTAVSFCFWIHRVTRNLGPLGNTDQRFSPRWAVIWWFVPLMQLFRPYQVVREVWTRSLSGPSEAMRPLLWSWWAAWIAANGMALVNSAAIFRGEEADVRITADVIALVRLSLMFTAVVLAFVIVRQITALQEERYRSFADSG